MGSSRPRRCPQGGPGAPPPRRPPRGGAARGAPWGQRRWRLDPTSALA
ncbi:MAG: hypothetical protein ACK5RA_00310 [Cyanobacteriota bacterium]